MLGLVQGFLSSYLLRVFGGTDFVSGGAGHFSFLPSNTTTAPAGLPWQSRLMLLLERLRFAEAQEGDGIVANRLAIALRINRRFICTTS
ncbi:MAG: hypothetical protein A2150_00830 [Candidatus Muproteobacteria bacterium RBG_16_64_11]|uniref:Uncharacterized protein n=1 Tax=Candidatus Muproteobacteria bacterium RBG_16_64_11 TaxID=1817758 RepID=A0A1F6TII6_9PROT|nr:MAG: hypothetical protein A2150_00830 [Candidatus Muproteobacteria bacterium RBG_16_64_11]